MRLVAAFCLSVLLFTPALAVSGGYGMVIMGKQSWVTVDEQPLNDLAEPYAHPRVYVGAVCNLRWKDLQPAQGGPLVTTTLDACITTWQIYNTTYPDNPLFMKLRVWGGRQAPDWAKSLDGGPLTVLESGPFTVGYWWTTDYRSAWSSFMAALASAYTGKSLITEVAVTSCAGGNGAEPFNIPVGISDLAALVAAGYTDAQGQDCMSHATDAFTGWTHQTLDLPFNIFNSVDTGVKVPVPAFTTSAMAAFRVAFPTGIIAFEGLQSPITGAVSYPIMPEFLALRTPVQFETVSQAQCTDASFNVGLAYYMTEFEVWNTTDAGGTCGYTLSQLQSMAAILNLKHTSGLLQLHQ